MAIVETGRLKRAPGRHLLRDFATVLGRDGASVRRDGRYLRRSIVFAFSLCSLAAPPVDGTGFQTPEAKVRVEVDGVRGDIRRNVLATLSIYAARNERVTESRIRRLHSRAIREIEIALEPFGHYRPQTAATLEFDSRRWRARYRIEPGPQVRVSGVDVQVTGPGRNEAVFAEALQTFPVAQGATLSHVAYEAGKAAFLDAALEAGYLDAMFTTNRLYVDRQADTAAVVLRFETGPRFRFGEVRFRQDILDSALLQGSVTFQRGQPLTGRGLLDLQTTLSEGPYFSRVEIEPRRDLAENFEVPIDVELVPRKPQRYFIGAGYGTNSGPRGTAEVEFRRLNRKGHRALLETSVSLIERRAGARYLIPFAYGRTEVLDFRVAYANLDPTTSNSEAITVGVGLARWRGRWQENFGITFQRERFEVGPDTGVAKLLVFNAGWSHVRADDRVYPSRGLALRIDAQGAAQGILSNATFASIRGSGKVIRRLGKGPRAIARIEGGATLSTDFRDLPPTIRFFTGGDQSVRGYQYRSLGPTDGAGNVIGGKVLFVSSIEFEQLIYRGWGVATFFDAGNALSSFPGKLETGTGVGVRWLSPVGLIRVDVAWGLSRADTSFRLHFVIGPDL